MAAVIEGPSPGRRGEADAHAAPPRVAAEGLHDQQLLGLARLIPQAAAAEEQRANYI